MPLSLLPLATEKSSYPKSSKVAHKISKKQKSHQIYPLSLITTNQVAIKEKTVVCCFQGLRELASGSSSVHQKVTDGL